MPAFVFSSGTLIFTEVSKKKRASLRRPDVWRGFARRGEAKRHGPFDRLARIFHQFAE